MNYRQTWLLVDTNYLCYRAYHSVGELTFAGEATGVLFGVMKTIQALSELFDTNRVAFCFDGPANKRYDIYPAYKGNRKRDDSYKLFKEQVDNLPGTLAEAGFPNVLRETGYEADDIMAKLAKGLPHDVEGILVTEDQDMYQCLRGNVWMHKPRKGTAYNLERFERDYLPVEQWAEVKAIAGCSSDNIDGVAGVGEKTAIKYLLGTLKKSTKAYQKIEEQKPLWSHNRQLVTLPIDDQIEAALDDVGHQPDHWGHLADKLGMASLSPKARSGKIKNKGFGLNG